MDIQKIIEEKFKFLVESGFILESRRLGREAYFDYSRNSDTISISCEAGSVPIVEIFEPVETSGLEVTPWASKDGIKRGRRFPNVKVRSEFSDPALYLEDLATQLAKAEADWITRS